jgi:DNA-binding transcriptional ArsR family regulator
MHNGRPSAQPEPQRMVATLRSNRHSAQRIAVGRNSAPRELARHAGDAARLLRALANEHRLMILCLLSEGELSVGALNERVGLSQSALSQHLAVLRTDELVTTRREAQTIYYALASGPVAAVIETLHGIYCSNRSGGRR